MKTALERYPISHELLERVQAIPPRAVLDDTLEPDPDLVDLLEDLHPDCHLAWEPRLQRWALYERVCNHYEFVAAIQGPNGEFRRPTIDNTVRHLDRLRRATRGIHNRHDVNRFLHDELDAEQEANARRIQRDAQDPIREGSKLIRDLRWPKTRIQVPNGVAKRRR